MTEDTNDPPNCPYGISGDTCVPIMEDYPCICELNRCLAEAQAREKRKDKALRIASEQFRRYEKLHRAKRTVDGMEKAATNAAVAKQMDEALAAPAPHHGLVSGPMDPAEYDWDDPERETERRVVATVCGHDAQKWVTNIPSDPGLVAVPQQIWDRAYKALAAQQQALESDRDT